MMKNLNRRQFLTGLTLLGLSGFITTSCSSPNQSVTPNSPGESNSNSILKVGALGKAASAQQDPHKLLPNDSDMLTCSLIWEAMTMPGSGDKNVVPRLMDNWNQASPTEWEFTIARNAVFHDSSPVTADDVVWSLNRMLKDEANRFRLPVIPSSISKIDDQRVRMSTEVPNSQLPLLARLMTFVMKKESDPKNPDHGLLRKNEFENVMKDYEHLGLNVVGVNAQERFFKALEGVSDPEQKRKIIGSCFIDVFDEAARNIKDVKWLAQGTIYPDVIESLSITGMTIKSHHNVGGLPEKMHLKLCEPLRLLFKDEVRRVGIELGMMRHLIKRQPFPGPGLAVRILGCVTPEKISILQEADDIFINGLRQWNLYDKVWQAGAILLPVQSVGVMGDERSYENAVALRAVSSTDAMTADWVHLPYDFLAKMSNEIINKVKGINRVVYDISSKPPATIEWE